MKHSSLVCWFLHLTSAFQPLRYYYKLQRRILIPLQYTKSDQITAPVSDKEHINPWTINDKELLHRNYHTKYVPNDIDYIIIGSGIGGLWLGACLSKFNKTILVLEQHYTAGGLQHTFQVQRRSSNNNSTSSNSVYEFVPGLHYIANLKLCAPLYDMVATPTDPPLRYHRSGNSVPADKGELCSHDLQIGNLPVMKVKEGIDNVRNELILVFPNEEYAINEFLRIMERAKWQAGQYATFKIFPYWLQWLLSNIICSNYIYYASRTTEDVLTKLTNDGRLKTVLSAFGGDLGESISDGSFVMQAAVLGHVLEGCYYPEGGPIQFARGLIPTIRHGGGDVLVNARVDEIVLENGRAVGVKLATKNEDFIRAKHGVVSDAGIRTTLNNLLPKHLLDGPLKKLHNAIEASSGGISHVFTFVGLNTTGIELNLRSSSFYYIPWNETNINMDATTIQDYYRDTLLNPNVMDVSAGMVFCTAKDPNYSTITMPGKSTVIIFSEAKADDFNQFIVKDNTTEKVSKKHLRTDEYQKAKELIEKKMMRSLLLNFPHLEPYIDVVEVATPLTLLDFTMRTETLGLRHTPRRMTDMEIRPDCSIPGLYFTGQDISFAGWAGALTGAMVTAQRLLGYTLLDFAQQKTLMRDLGRGDIEDMIQANVKNATQATPIDVFVEICGNGWRWLKKELLK